MKCVVSSNCTFDGVSNTAAHAASSEGHFEIRIYSICKEYLGGIKVKSGVGVSFLYLRMSPRVLSVFGLRLNTEVWGLWVKFSIR